jgi:uncharacterized RDD family membrane protein YckC
MPDEAMLEPMIESLGIETSIEGSEKKSSAAIPAIAEGPGILLRTGPSAEFIATSLDHAADDAVEKPVADWRAELAIKMQSYRTRRKPRAPKYPSLQMPLQLPSETPETHEVFRTISADASRSSNALEPAVQSEPEVAWLGPELVETAGIPAAEAVSPASPALPPPTNLIEFPRSMESEAWDGLAEPVIEQPRILDAPELVPPEPALGGILLEEPQEMNSAPATDVPIRPASIKRRVLAVMADGIVVACAVALWGWLVTKITRELPPRPQLLISATVAAGVLWLSYQYLLTVYCGTTLGLRACRMELVALDGTTPGRKQRRWRWLASLLSATSVMLGYAWVLLDENRLCWHDRITHTYLRVRERQPL